MSRAAVFLDRDGVLCDSAVVDGLPRAPLETSDLQILPRSASACRQLRAAGLVLIAITNQPEVARGRLDPNGLEAMNDTLQAELGLDEVMVCPHDDADDCECRKPRPGMILQAAKRWQIELSRSVTVGDRWRDVDAGGNAGTATVFVDRGYAEPLRRRPDLVVRDLEEATEWIIERAVS